MKYLTTEFIAHNVVLGFLSLYFWSVQARFKQLVCHELNSKTCSANVRCPTSTILICCWYLICQLPHIFISGGIKQERDDRLGKTSMAYIEKGLYHVQLKKRLFCVELNTINSTHGAKSSFQTNVKHVAITLCNYDSKKCFTNINMHVTLSCMSTEIGFFSVPWRIGWFCSCLYEQQKCNNDSFPIEYLISVYLSIRRNLQSRKGDTNLGEKRIQSSY